jgi:hypothetical protein
VRTRSLAYRIIFNPRPSDYGPAMFDTGYASAYRPGAPTTTVLSRAVRDPVRRATFRVPSVPPGIYLVLIFDGSEGGSHATWDYFHVLGPAQSAPRGRAIAKSGDDSEDEDELELVQPAGFVVAGFALGSAAAALRRRTRQRNS